MSMSPTLFSHLRLPLIRTVSIVCMLFPLAGCLDTYSTRIEGDRARVFQPVVRASINLGDAGKPPSETRSGAAIEISYQKSSITSTQEVPAGAYPVYFAGNTFFSPVQLTNVFDFSYRNALFRGRQFLDGQPLGFEFAAGIGAASMGITINSTTQRAAQEFSEEGLELAGGIIWRMNSASSLNLHYSNFSSLGILSDNYEFYYLGAITDNVILRAGYSVWDIQGTTGGATSDYHLKFSGPSLSLEFAFGGS